MILWWKTRQRRLWWKELRESWPVLGLGWLIIIAFAYKIPADVSSRYIWGMDFNMTATAILLFVVMVLGVTAYAVEEEYETLEPLMARPIPLNDILATKLGVRLGLVFLSALLMGTIELVTGAWPIEYGIPSPVVFERWMGSLMIMICGLGLGFYFGKVLGRQITALLSAGLIFAAGWVLLSLSPLSFLFEGEEGETIYWIKQILLPGLLGTVAILASIRARTGEGTILTRPVVAAAGHSGEVAIASSSISMAITTAYLTPSGKTIGSRSHLLLANSHLWSSSVTPTRSAPKKRAAFLTWPVISERSSTSTGFLYHWSPMRLGPQGLTRRSQLKASVQTSWTVHEASVRA